MQFCWSCFWHYTQRVSDYIIYHFLHLLNTLITWQEFLIFCGFPGYHNYSFCNGGMFVTDWNTSGALKPFVRSPHIKISRDFRGPRTCFSALLALTSVHRRSSGNPLVVRSLDRSPNLEYPCNTSYCKAVCHTPYCRSKILRTYYVQV